MRTHGKIGTYGAGCSCAECREANRVYRRTYTNRRKSNLLLVAGRLVHPTAPHGTSGGYGNYGCRCVPCTAANARASANNRERARRRVAS